MELEIRNLWQVWSGWKGILAKEIDLAIPARCPGRLRAASRDQALEVWAYLEHVILHARS